MKRIVAVLFLVGVVGVGLFAVRRVTGFASGNGKSAVDVKLTMQGSVCKVQEPVDDLGGDRLFKNKIRWNVTNDNCETQQYVAFLEYRERIGSSLGEVEHVVDPDPAYSKQIAQGGRDEVLAKIDKLNWTFNDKKYKYKICVGPNPKPTTNCLDPDVDVWPF